MDLRWVNKAFDTSWCWLEHDVLSGSKQQEKFKLDRNSSHTNFSVSGQQHLACNSLPSLFCSPSSPSSPHLSFFKHFSSWRSFPPTLCPSALPRLSLSPSRKIQYLSQSVWVHSPLSLGVLPLALRWISLGLIDITLVMKYAYHDQRWRQQRRRLKSSQPGVDVLLKTVSVSGSLCAKLRCCK